MNVRANRPRQGGMVLIVSLIILLVLTLLGLAAIQNTSMEERMAGNMRRENLAFQAAESALRAGEAWLFLLTAPPTVGKVQDGHFIWGFGDDGTATSPEFLYKDDEKSWWQEWSNGDWTNNSYTNAFDDALEFTADGAALPAPRYLIEERGIVQDSLVVGQQQDFSSGGRTFYQVTARGVDSTGRSEVILRSTYARRF